jgi:hypothetical protein
MFHASPLAHPKKGEVLTKTNINSKVSNKVTKQGVERGGCPIGI